MTREEMISYLKQIEKDIFVCSLESTFEDDAKSCAIHEAIRLLEREHCEDAISRQAVINFCNQIISRDTDENDIIKVFNAMLFYLRKLPSVLPIQQSCGFAKDINVSATDCISRQEAIAAIGNYCENVCDLREYKWCPSCQYEEFNNILKGLPPVNIKEEKQMDDLISRRAAVSVANDFDATQVVRGLEKLPSVTPEQKAGKWITLKDEYGDVVEAVCSNCGRNGRHTWKYCPDCGKMKEVSE